MRLRLSRAHFAYLQRHYRYRRFTWGRFQTETMVASQVFAEDGTPEVIVTTFLLDGRVYHDVERI